MERRILRKIRKKSEECGGIRAIGLQSVGERRNIVSAFGSRSLNEAGGKVVP